jgi:hypothetical protein
MNEDQIERWYEREMNALDADLLQLWGLSF